MSSSTPSVAFDAAAVLFDKGHQRPTYTTSSEWLNLPKKHSAAAAAAAKVQFSVALHPIEENTHTQKKTLLTSFAAFRACMNECVLLFHLQIDPLIRPNP